MAAFKDCNDFCCPRQTKEIQQKIGRHPYSFDNAKYTSMWDWASLRTGYDDKLAYDACCANSKRRIGTPEDQTPYQDEGLRDLGGPYATLSWAAQRPFLVKKKKSKWLEEHEKRLQEEAEAQATYTPAKYTMWQNLIKALVKLRRLERYRLQNAQQRLDAEQAVAEPVKDLNGSHLTHEKPDLNEEKKKAKPTPEHIEADLLNLFGKVGSMGKDKKKGSLVLDTPFGKYTQSETRDARRINDFVAALHRTAKKIKKRNAQKNGTPRSNRSLKRMHQDNIDRLYPSINKTAPHAKPVEQMERGKAKLAAKVHPLLKIQHGLQTSVSAKIPQKKTTKVGVKFSWNSRKILKGNTRAKTIMSKPFDKQLKGKNVKLPELMPHPKNQFFEKRMSKNEEKNRGKKEEKYRGKRIRKSSSGTQKSRVKSNSDPNYRAHKTGKSRRRSSDIKPQISQQFHKMLRGKHAKIPELNSSLMSRTKIIPPSKKNKMNLKDKTLHKIMSQSFDKGKNVEVPELLPALRSPHQILDFIDKKDEKKTVKEEGKSYSVTHKSIVKSNSEPNYRAHKTGKSRRRSSDIKPQISQQFHKMLRGKHARIPELKSSLMSRTKIIPPNKKNRMKLKDKTLHKIMSQSFDKLFEGKNVEMPELLPALRSQHQILDKIIDKKEEKKAVKEERKSTFGTYKPKLKDNSVPSDEVHKTAKSRQRSNDITPQISQQFHKMLRYKKGRIAELMTPLMSSTETFSTSKKKRIMSKRFDKMFEGKDVEMPELIPALKSQHQLLTKKKVKKMVKEEEKSSSRTHKSKLKGHTRKRSNDISPQISLQFHKMVRGKKGRSSELTPPLMGPIEIFPKSNTQKRASKKSELSFLRSNLKEKGSHISFKKKRYSAPISRRSLRLVVPGNVLPLKKFSYYIRNSAPDRSIVRKDGSKRLISYLSKKSISSLISNKLEIAEKKARARGSIVNRADIVQSLLSAREKAKRVMELPRTDVDDFMFGTVPENHQPQDKQDPKTSELIANREKVIENHQPHPKTVSELIANAEKVIKDSQSHLQSVRDEINKVESEELWQQTAQEKFQQDFVLEEKSVVQARIRELMKYVVIRDDFRPPKRPRDFVKENIEMLQKMQPPKRVQAKKKRKPNKLFSSTLEYLQMPKLPDIPESDCAQQLLGQAFVSSKPLRIRRHKDFTFGNQKDRPEIHSKADPVETEEREIQKCEICDMLRSAECASPDFIQKTKAQKLLSRAWNHEMELDKWCPKYC